MKAVNIRKELKNSYSDHSMNVYHEAYSASIYMCIRYEKK